MFVSQITGTVSQLHPNDQTLFQCTLNLTVPLDLLDRIQPGSLLAAENVFSAAKKARYTILQVVGTFPIEGAAKKVKSAGLTLSCTATPIGLELADQGLKKPPLIQASDTFPALEAAAWLLDDETTLSVIHQIAPESHSQVNGSRIDVGAYATNPEVKVGLDATSLLRGNMAIISARPRARTTIANTLLSALLGNPSYPVHVVYCDVNNQGSMSLLPLLTGMDRSTVLCINDKFVPQSVYASMKAPGDRSAHKRATLDYLDMMILPSVLESRRHDFSYGVSQLFRANKVAIYRPNEQTVDQFLNDIRIDILDGAEADVETYVNGVINGIVETYAGERFGDKNTRDVMEMLDEFSQESKSHAARRTLYDLRTEIQAAYETYSKDIPSAVRKSLQDVVGSLNDETSSSLLVVQGQKTSDILRFVSALGQTLVEERLKRLKIRVPVLFIFNNADEYVARNGGAYRESGADRFQDVLQMLLTNGRRHGLGFCLTLESAASIDRGLGRKIGSYFIGPIPFTDAPPQIAQLLNVSEDLLRPAANYEDGRFLFASADSPYHRRVPLPVSTTKNTELLHTYLDTLVVEAERRRIEYQAQEEERMRRYAIEKEERRRKLEEQGITAPPEDETPKADEDPRHADDNRRQQDARQPRRDDKQRDDRRRDDRPRDDRRRDDRPRDDRPRDDRPRDDRPRDDRPRDDRPRDDRPRDDRPRDDRPRDDRPRDDRRRDDRPRDDRPRDDRPRDDRPRDDRPRDDRPRDDRPRDDRPRDDRPRDDRPRDDQRRNDPKQGDRQQRPDKAPGAPRPERPQQPEKPPRQERPPAPAKPVRVERPEATEGSVPDAPPPQAEVPRAKANKRGGRGRGADKDEAQTGETPVVPPHAPAAEATQLTFETTRTGGYDMSDGGPGIDTPAGDAPDIAPDDGADDDGAETKDGKRRSSRGRRGRRGGKK